MAAGIRSTKTENTQGIRKFHRNSLLEAISGEILTRMYALNSTAIKIFHRISALEVISGEILSWMYALNSTAIKFFHRISAPEAISGEIPANHASKVAITVIWQYSQFSTRNSLERFKNCHLQTVL